MVSHPQNIRLNFVYLLFCRHLAISSMILNNTGCQMSIAKNAMNVVANSTPFEGGTIAEYVVRFFAVVAVAKKYLDKPWGSAVIRIRFNFDYSFYLAFEQQTLQTLHNMKQICGLL